MADQVFLCTSHNGKRVTYDPVDSHAATHLADTPGLKELAIEVLENTDLLPGRLNFDKDLGRIVGTTDVVATDDTDELVWAIRKGRDDDEFVPFTKSRPAEPCQWVSVSLDEQTDGSYILFSAWIGEFDSPGFPGTKYETPESKAYWTKYAFVWGSQEIKPGSETPVCPW